MINQSIEFMEASSASDSERDASLPPDVGHGRGRGRGRGRERGRVGGREHKRGRGRG